MEGLKAGSAAGLWGLGDSSLVLSIHTSRSCVSPLALKGCLSLHFFDWDTLQPKANTQQDCPGHRASITNQSNSLQAKSQREDCGTQMSPGKELGSRQDWKESPGGSGRKALLRPCSDAALPSPNQKDKKQTAAGGVSSMCLTRNGHKPSSSSIGSIRQIAQIPFTDRDTGSVIFPEPQSHRGAKS